MTESHQHWSFIWDLMNLHLLNLNLFLTEILNLVSKWRSLNQSESEQINGSMSRGWSETCNDLNSDQSGWLIVLMIHFNEMFPVTTKKKKKNCLTSHFFVKFDLLVNVSVQTDECDWICFQQDCKWIRNCFYITD